MPFWEATFLLTLRRSFSALLSVHTVPGTHLTPQCPCLSFWQLYFLVFSPVFFWAQKKTGRDRSTRRSGSKKPAVPSFDFQVGLLGSHRPRGSLTQERQRHNLTTIGNNPAWTLMVSVYVIGPLRLFACRRVVLQPLMSLGYFDYWV